MSINLTAMHLRRDSTKYADYLLDTTVPAAGETLSSGAAVRWFLRKIDELQVAGVRSLRCFGSCFCADNLGQQREVVWRKFQVLQWIAPPTAMMTPSVLSKVAWHALTQ